MAANELQLKLQQQLLAIGAVRPEAWAAIQEHLQTTTLTQGQSFIRTEGCLAYIATGLLKEYDTYGRLSPSIINFIPPLSFFITRKHNRQHYLKACIPTHVYYWQSADLRLLADRYQELIPIYHTVCAGYDAQQSFRALILEELLAANRIRKFISRFGTHINYIRKKDIANYLGLYYDTFMKHYRLLLKS